MGVDSGLPDFRGAEGFWRAYPPYRALGLRFEELADPVHFADDPGWPGASTGTASRSTAATVPHAGFAVLRRWARERPTRVFTSNVDGQFQAAGFAPRSSPSARLHPPLQCLAGCGAPVWSRPDGRRRRPRERRCAPYRRCRRVPRCGALARPNILMFGDGDWDPAEAAPG